jgi:hypothetical protein
MTLAEFRDKVYANNPGVQPIFTSRDDFLENTVGFYLKDTSLNLKLKPRVKFFSELGNSSILFPYYFLFSKSEYFSGQDLGGVTREYFYKALSSITSEKYQGRYSIFEGQIGRLLPSLDSVLLRVGVFKAVGRLMAHSLIHCGVAGFGIAKPVYEYLCSKDVDSQFPFTVEVEDISSMEVRAAVEKVQI